MIYAAIAITFGVYLLRCKIWPYTACVYCKGHKRKMDPGGGGFRFCPTCGGSGLRRRFGAVLLDKGRSRK